MFESITYVELWDVPGPELDLGDGKKRFILPKGMDVTIHVIGEKLVIIPAKANELAESEQATYVPRHRSNAGLGDRVSP